MGFPQAAGRHQAPAGAAAVAAVDINRCVDSTVADWGTGGVQKELGGAVGQETVQEEVMVFRRRRGRCHYHVIVLREDAT